VKPFRGEMKGFWIVDGVSEWGTTLLVVKRKKKRGKNRSKRFSV